MPSPVPAFTFQPTFLEKIFSNLKRKRLHVLEGQHSVLTAKWQAEVDEISNQNLQQRQKEDTDHARLLKQFEEEKLCYELAQTQKNQLIDEQRDRYYASEPEALIEYWYRLFTDQAYPDSWPEDCQLQYMEEAKKLILDYELPPIESFPAIKEVRYVANRKEFKEVPIPEAQQKKRNTTTRFIKLPWQASTRYSNRTQSTRWR